MLVTLVEDDPVVLSLLSELLRAHGHDVHPVLIAGEDTVATGLARLAARPAPVVLLDLGMPVPGLELLRAAQSDRRFENVRYLVASASFRETERDVVPGARSIAKPYEVPELLAAIAGA